MVTRKKRRIAKVPEQPSGTLDLQIPPEKAEPASIGNVLMMVIPMLGSTGVMIFMALQQQQQQSNPRMLLMGGGMLVAMLGMVGFNMYRQFSQYRTRVVTQRREYLSYLAETREAVRKVAKKQRAYYNWVYPDPDALVTLASNGSPVVARGQHLRPAGVPLRQRHPAPRLDVQPSADRPDDRDGRGVSVCDGPLHRGSRSHG